MFKKATEAKLQTEIVQAREKLELVLSEAKVQKYTDPKYNQDEYLDEMILNQIVNSKVKEDVAICDGFAFEIDRSIPTIGKYVGEEKELTFPKVQLSKSIAEDLQTATITIKAKEEKNGINKIVIMQRGFIIETFTYDNEKEEITIDYDKITRNGKYVIKATAALKVTKIENITDLVSSIQYSPNGNSTWKKEHSVKVKVKENIDKIESIKYQWTDTNVEPSISSFSKTVEDGGTITENTLTGKYYLWTLLEETNGSQRIEKSEGFHFDNEGPEIATEISYNEDSAILYITAKDNCSGIKYYHYYYKHIDNDNWIEEKTIETSSEEIQVKANRN